MSKKNLLTEKLKSYSLLAGSMLASSLVAKGQVVYHDVNPDVELGGVAPASYPKFEADSLDLNNDGIFDFRISINFQSFASNQYRFKEKIDGSFNFSNAVISYTVDYIPFALKLNCGDSIPPPYLYGFNHAYFAFVYQNVNNMNWNNVHDKTVGLKFKIGNSIHSGWVRLDVNTNGTVPNIIIKDYAYELTPEHLIAACDTGFAVGISSPEEANSFTAFPNPSNGHCVISLPASLSGDVEVSVADALGRRVFTSTETINKQNELTFDFSNFASGVYFIHLKDDNISLSQKWIKK